MTGAPERNLDRLARAIEAWLTRSPGPEGQREVLLRHPDLHDLLGTLARNDGDTAPDERRLGGYRLVREIGRGGMGVVYEARDLSLDRRVALKVLPPHWGADARRIARFRREALALGGLAHPGIVRVFATGEDGGTHWFAMELVDGVQIAPGPAAEVVPLIARVADALQHAHDRGLVHRDVKPANILVRRDRSPVLTDFGLVHAEDLPAMTRSGDFAGTPHYVSPEQARGGRVTPQSDVYSLGATLYELLTGTRPFGDGTTAAVLARILREEPLEPQRLDPKLAPDLCAIVLKAMEKQPPARYASAAELASDLRAFLEYRPVQARRASAGRRLLRGMRREPWKAGLVCTALVGVPLVAALVGYLLASERAIVVGSEKLGRDAREALLADGWSELVGGDSQRAEERFRALLELAPAHVEGTVGLALTLRRRGRLDLALALVERGVAAEADPALQRARAWLLADAGRDAAARALEAELGPPARSSELFVAACRAFADNATADAGPYARACDLMERAILASEQPRALYFQQWAWIAFALRDAAKLARCADAMRVLWPESPRTWVTVGRGELLDDPRAAAKSFATAVRLDPACEQAHVFLGSTHEMLEDVGAAERSYRAALRLVPDSIAGYALGDLLVRSGRHEEAIPLLRAACARRRDFVPGLVSLGKALLGVGARTEALSELERAQALPKDPAFEEEIRELLARARG